MSKKPIVKAFLCMCMLLVSLSANAQGKKVTINAKDLALTAALRQVEQQSGYYKINYPSAEISRYKVTANVKNQSAPEAVKSLLKGLPFESTVNGQFIQIKQSFRAASNDQRKAVRGKLLDADGEPLIGATVMVEGTNIGTVTDIDGNYVLEGVDENQTLTYSYIGKRPMQRRAGSKNAVIILEDENNLMDEVVVTGYQNIKRENATGSYQLITSKKLDERHTGTIVENLEGQIPGLMSYNNGLNGGGENALTIRGTSSFQARTNPLVVVDGLPIEGGIETINPYNIENITVLKDAAAAAIYGARASNGVIVVTTKRAQQEKLEVDFSTDITISEKQNYDNYGWINSSQLIELEKYHFNSMKTDEDQNSMQSMLNYYTTNRNALTPIMQILAGNYLGEVSNSEMESTFNQWAKNDYRKEWQDVYERMKVLQQYNLSLRTKGKYLNSTIVLNYKNDNLGMVKERNNALTFSYRGDLDATKWLKLSFGTNIISERAKTHVSSEFNGINGFLPYQSMYNTDGSAAALEASISLSEQAFQNSAYELKDPAYYPLDELNTNFNNSRRTNIRTFANAIVTIIPGWTASAYFQYEDIYYKNDRYLEADSYRMRYLYNIYTSETSGVIKHYIPEGGQLITNTNEGAYYTFRAQTGYNKIFAEKHAVEALAGFEFRQTNMKTNNNLILGYDDQTQTNRSGLVNFGELKDIKGSPSVIGKSYVMYGAPDDKSISTSNVLHRFYSLYFTGNYTYYSRYSASVSYRVDKTDLFGADPKFRGRPLWSVGASWNIHNEAFMKSYAWVDALKLRASYGLTGNIDSSVSSFLTASIANEYIYGKRAASLNTPPNDQLRWEKTSSWNLGMDFSFWSNRLSGSFDYYLKKGSDLLTLTDLDSTTGWKQLTINNGEMRNRGMELQLNGELLKPKNRNDIGINASFNIAYNKNKVTTVFHEPSSGYESLRPNTLHKGYPVHSLFSVQFAGLSTEDNMQYVNWRDSAGEIHSSNATASSDFKVEDAVYSGSLDPKVMSSLTPEITYAGFSLSAMFSYYGGHVMRVCADDWDAAIGSQNGFIGLMSSGEIPASAMNYWTTGKKDTYIANGYQRMNVIGYQSTPYLDNLVEPADYMKLRNLVLGYSFPKEWCQKMGMNAIRLRIQMNNVCTWVRNKYDIDPEANSPTAGTPLNKTPKSYTMSLHVNF